MKGEMDEARVKSSWGGFELCEGKKIRIGKKLGANKSKSRQTGRRLTATKVTHPLFATRKRVG